LFNKLCSPGSPNPEILNCISPGGIATTTSISASKLGTIIEIAGGAAFLLGAVLSIHHYAVALLTIGGAVAFFVGKKLRGGTAL
jgi:hypothetical protein